MGFDKVEYYPLSVCGWSFRKSDGGKTGCTVGDRLINHTMHADDSVVLSPYSAALQQLLRACSSCDVQYDTNGDTNRRCPPWIYGDCISPLCCWVEDVCKDPHFRKCGFLCSQNHAVISSAGVFAPTLFSKTFGNLVCESCTNIPGNASVPFICRDCHYDSVGCFT